MTDSIRQDEYESGTVLSEELQEPRKFRVLLHNDDYTTMEFVVHVLKAVFNKSDADATQIMLSVHKNGTGLCGVYTAEMAETKVVAVRQLARENGYPLKCTMEEE
jgi:ATP-dependent Clp protease adaptor protein ClpS